MGLHLQLATAAHRNLAERDRPALLAREHFPQAALESGASTIQSGELRAADERRPG
jgi:hypothetical protein